MAAVMELGQPIVVRGDDGRLRRYPDPSVLRPYHIEQKPQSIDRERCALVKQRDSLVEAERRLRTMRFAVADLDVADYVFDWLDQEIRQIQRTLHMVRSAMHFTWDRLDLAPEDLS
jgi:hypothetical protein